MAPLIRRAAALAAAVAGLAGPAGGQSAAAGAVTVVADSSFVRGGLHRLLFGPDYRDLWATPIRVDVLDLDAFAGGLRPIRRGGGRQTASLRLQAGDGRQFVFRSVRKDPQSIVPADLRGTFVESVVRDQVSAIHPAGALVIPPILDAAGVLHVTPVLRVMPDHAALGEHRAEFAGMLGLLEERPTESDEGAPGFADALDVDGTEALIRELERHPWARVDERGFLTARLLDLLVGDWDRHEDQWRWALIGTEDNAVWRPIPRDRDQAFARYDGLLMELARQVAPRLLNFGEDYAPPDAATWNGRYLDRRLLTALERPVWDSIATGLRDRLTDSVIRAGVDRLPEAYRAADGERLFRTLQVRRDRLPEAAAEWYRILARQVTLFGGDGDDLVEAIRYPGGETEVRLYRRGRTTPYYRRVFDPDETDEVRIHLRGGDDYAIVRGTGRGPLLRIVAGTGRDTLLDGSTSRHTRFYDVGEHTVAAGAPVDRRRYERVDREASTLGRERDWGAMTLAGPRFSASSDVGFTPGFRLARRTFGFRRQPWATSSVLLLEYSLLLQDARVRFEGRHKLVNRQTHVTLDAMMSGLEGLRFHGFGNGSPGDADDAFYRVRQRTWLLAPGIGWGLDRPVKFHLTARLRHTVTDPDDPANRDGRIGEVRPLGLGEFGQLGLGGRFEVDTRDSRTFATRGIRARIEGAAWPFTWGDDDRAFSTLAAEVSAFLTPAVLDRVTLALRVGARQTFGEAPYFEASYLGGKGSLRGFPQNRFAGNDALFGNAEVRVRLADTRVVVPGELGVVGLLDAGRVLTGLNEDKTWHGSLGGGLWYAVLKRAIVLSAGAAGGEEGLRMYLGFGMGY